MMLLIEIDREKWDILKQDEKLLERLQGFLTTLYEEKTKEEVKESGN